MTAILYIKRPHLTHPSFNQWLSAFHNFVVNFDGKFPTKLQVMNYDKIICDISAKLRYMRQSALDLYPWDVIHWDLWLKTVLNFRL